MTTNIYKTKSEFLQRAVKSYNGVSENFAKNNPDYENENSTNKGCWNCSDCYGCSDCSDCSRCSDCYGCYDCSDCSRCYGCSDCSRCSDCSDCYGCSDCSRCSDCYGCSDCSRCSDCSDCYGCYDCYDKKSDIKYPVVIDLNKKVLAAISSESSLDMSDWHICKTTHCWAGWIVTLAGDKGMELENKTSTLFAAMMIYKKSNDGKSISPCNFFLSNEDARAKITELASIQHEI